MKLRLFGCAAAYILAGTLSVSAQEAPEPRMKDGVSESAPSPEGRGASGEVRQKEAPAKGRPESAQGADRSEQKKSDRIERSARGGDNRKQEKSARDASDKNTPGSDNAKNKANREPSRSDAPRKAEQDRGEKSATRDSERESGHTDAPKQGKDAADNEGAKRDQATDRTGEGKNAGKQVQLSAEKRDRVQSSLRSDLKLKRETKVDIDISIGTRAPRHWAFAPVPAAVIQIVPEYRGYVVAYVEDEYVICDPDTYEIVAVLPASGGGFASTGYSSGEGGSDQCSTSLSLTESEERELLLEVETTREVEASGVTIGWSVPSDIELQTFPGPVLDRSSKLSGCRYFVVEDQIAIVDPQQDKVVLLIENNQ